MEPAAGNGRAAEKHNPTEAVLRDLPSVLNVLLWGAVVIWIVYGGA